MQLVRVYVDQVDDKYEKMGSDELWLIKLLVLVTFVVQF